MAYDKRITDLAAIAAIAAGKNARVAPQLLSADFTFALADAVEDGRIILGSDSPSPANPAPVEQGEIEQALAWYGEQARLARLVHSEGDEGRNALAADGGKRARSLLARHRQSAATVGEVETIAAAIFKAENDISGNEITWAEWLEYVADKRLLHGTTERIRRIARTVNEALTAKAGEQE